jgi:hypothetical protein
VANFMSDDHCFVLSGLTAGDVNHEGPTVEKTVDAMTDDRAGLIVLELQVFKRQGCGDNGIALAIALAFHKGSLMALARLEPDVPPSIHALILSQPVPLPRLGH